MSKARVWPYGAVALGMTLALAGCSSGENTWEWSSAEDSGSPAAVDYYFDYPTDSEFRLGDISALVQVESLKHNVGVPASEGAQAWAYTPAIVRIVEPGNSGLKVGAVLTIAIPGGTADGLASSSVWRFEKAALDSKSTYLASWTPYDYPKFELPYVLQYIYEKSGDTFTRLQTAPSVSPDTEALPEFTLGEVASALKSEDDLGSLVASVFPSAS